MNPKDFIQKKKIEGFNKALQEGKVPDQGCFVSLFNNDYKVLTKADAAICILEDIKGNKVPYRKSELVKLLKKSAEEKNDLAKAEQAAAGPKKTTFAVGEIHNGRKKIVSQRTGKTIWVDVGQGHAYAEHDSTEKQPQEGAKEQFNDFFASVSGKIHPGDKMKIARQLKEVMAIKEQITNLKEVAAHDSANKEKPITSQRDKMFALQDKYTSKFKELKTALVESAKKWKSESGGKE